MIRTRRTDCKQCGVVKTIENCGVLKNGYWRSYCKRCDSENNKTKRNARGRWEYVIYCFKDTGLTVTYIGATGHYHHRMRNHRSKGTIHPYEVSYILETLECLTKEEGAAWAVERENHYMDVHADTIRNKYRSGMRVQPTYTHHDE